MKLQPQITPLKSRMGTIMKSTILKYGVIVFVSLLALGLSSAVLAQGPKGGQGPGMKVSERDASGKAKRIDLDFVGADLQSLLRFLSKETDLTIIASEQDIKDKKFSLTNLRNVTVEQALEQIKTVLAQYDLTMIRTDKTILITTLDKAVKMKVKTQVINADPSEVEETDEVQTYIIHMKNAIVTNDLIQNFKGMVSKSAVLFADSTSNTIVITDIASNIRRIVKILQIIDKPLEVGMKIKVFPLSNGNAQSIARTLNDLFAEETKMSVEAVRHGNPEEVKKMLQFAKTKGIDVIQGRVMIAADTDSNSLIVKASEQNMELLSKLIEQLDTAPNVQMETKIYKLDYATAADVAQELEEIVTGTSAGKRPGKNADWWQRRDWEKRREEMKKRGTNVESIIGTVNITSDQRLNAVIIGTDPRNFSLIEKIIKELDTPNPKQEIKIFFVENANAMTMVQNLQDLFQGNSQSNRNLPWWARPRRNQQNQGGGFGVQGQVNLIADDRLNAILVSTAPQNLPIVEDLIKKLDVVMPSQEWATRIYPLKYADAENVANIINSVYQGQNGGRNSFFFFLPRRQRTQTQGSLAGNVQAQEYLPMNAVIISTSTARNFELIEKFIKELDQPTPEDQREVTHSIRLEYANASDMEQVLNNIWESNQQGRFNFRRFLMRGGAPEQKDIESLKGHVQIYADTQTNSLIVTTRQRYMQSVEDLIKQLDFVRGMVWLDISILEITLDDNTKLGIELSAEQNNIFGSNWTGNLQAKLGLGQEISGFDYNLATEKYLALIHTLMQQNKAKTLSTPSVITRDNQPVTFTRGKRIPYLKSARETTYAGPGQRIYDYDFLDTGITISITPHIAKSQAESKGEKRTIGLEINKVQVDNFLEFTDFNAPITENSSITGYIDVKDGQSIVIGGMIRSRLQKIEDKVPILGDIPLLGRLFENTNDVKENSELVIIITPRIVDIKKAEDMTNLKKHSDEVFPNTKEEIKKHFDASKLRMKPKGTKK